jgi:hypothetical protein
MVEGVAHPHGNTVGHSVGILQDLNGSHANQFKALFSQVIVPHGVMFGPIAKCVNLSINLNDKPRFDAAEIGHIRPNGMLSAKLETQFASTKPLPKHHLWRRHRSPQLARVVDPGPLLGR